MFSIRMHASRKIKSQKSKIKKTLNSQLSTLNSIHISGAEGIYEEKDIRKVCNEYIQRALTHPKGKPDEIFITIEEIKQKPKKIPLLKIKTLKCESPQEAEKVIFKMLSDTGISLKAINGALKVLKSKKIMRGASLILNNSGKRAEPDKDRGVRVSRMGIEENAEEKLSQMLYKIVIPAKTGHPQRLARARIQSKEIGFRVKPGMTDAHDKMIKNNITTVKEALILASKGASCPSVIVEVCISDDPDYTTGYISSKKLGYLRIPNIKKLGEMYGGRVVFIKEDAAVERLVGYLEKTPVIIKIQ